MTAIENLYALAVANMPGGIQLAASQVAELATVVVKLGQENARLREKTVETEGQIDFMCAEADQLQKENERIRAGLLNQHGDDLCWLDEQKGKIPPRAEFLESCSRFHAQISGTVGTLSGCMTIAQLETENARLRAENERMRSAEEK